MKLKSTARIVVAGLSVLALSACISNTPEKSDNVGGTSNAKAGSNDEKGDQLNVIRIVMPKNLDDEDRRRIDEVAKKHPIQARADVPWNL